MKQRIEKPKYQNIIDITDLLKDKSGKNISIKNAPTSCQYDFLVAVQDKKGQGYFFEVKDGKVENAYAVGGNKHDLPDFQKVFKEYNLDRFLEQYTGVRKAA